jgi:hypothetical protein
MMVNRADIDNLLKMTQSRSSLAHAAKILARHGLDRLRYSRGTRLVMGNALAGRLLLSLIKRDVDMVLVTSIVSLSQGEGAITGAVVTSKGVTRHVEATSAVVLAGGGYTRNAARRREFMPEPVPQVSPSAPGHTGE